MQRIRRARTGTRIREYVENAAQLADARTHRRAASQAAAHGQGFWMNQVKLCRFLDPGKAENRKAEEYGKAREAARLILDPEPLAFAPIPARLGIKPKKKEEEEASYCPLCALATI